MKAKLIVEAYNDGTFAFVLKIYDPAFMTESGDEPKEGEDRVDYLVSKFFTDKDVCKETGEALAKRLSLDYEVVRKPVKSEIGYIV